MSNQAFILQAYSAFNGRNVDSVFALMTEDVSWPKASEGGRVVGKQDIRDYWIRQWADFDPHVEVLEIVDLANGKTGVKVRQLVKNHKGDVLSDTEVWHIYTIHNNLIERMDILEADGNTDGQSAAFTGQGY